MHVKHAFLLEMFLDHFKKYQERVMSASEEYSEVHSTQKEHICGGCLTYFCAKQSVTFSLTTECYTFWYAFDDDVAASRLEV